jgi:hypothetical protein
MIKPQVSGELMPKTSHVCCATHSCTKPRYKLEYNYQHEDVVNELFPVNDGYHNMVVDGWWYNYETAKVIVIDSRHYADSKNDEFQKQRLSELNCLSVRLRFPNGESPAYSETIVEQCKSNGHIAKFTEKQLIEFLRHVTGNPVGFEDFPIAGPYTYYNSVLWETRSQYASNNQVQQWIRTPPQLCSVHHQCMFYDIDSWTCNLNTGKSCMFEFKRENELEAFYHGKYGKSPEKWKFEQCMRLTDKCLNDNIIRMFVISNENGRITTHHINRGISDPSVDVFGEYRGYDDWSDWSTDIKRLLS